MKQNSSLKLKPRKKIVKDSDQQGLEQVVNKVRIDAQKNASAFVKESVVVEGGE